MTDGTARIRAGALPGTLLSLLLLAACGSVPDSGPPPGTLDPDEIENAVPRDDPPSRYGNPDSYTVLGRTYHVMDSASGYVQRGIASWYGNKFHGRRTSSGEPYDMYAMTAAHKTLPLPTYVRVTNLDNGRTAIVRVNDRGPFKDNRLIDLSYAAAVKLGIVANGTGLVEVAAIDPAHPEAVPAGPAGAGTVREEIWIQLGAFGESRNAYRMLGSLAQAGFDKARVVEGDGLFRVRIGPLATPAEADRLTRELRDRLGIDATELLLIP